MGLSSWLAVCCFCPTRLCQLFRSKIMLRLQLRQQLVTKRLKEPARWSTDMRLRQCHAGPEPKKGKLSIGAF